MKIGDEVYIHGYIDEIRKDTIIIHNEGGYFGTVQEEISVKQEPKTGHWEWQTNSDLETTLCSLPKIQSEDGQDYVQLADVLETVRRYKPSVDKPQERSEE